MSCRVCIPVLLAIAGGCERKPSPSAGDAPAPPLVEAIEATPAPPETAAGGPEDAAVRDPAAERPCEIAWSVAAVEGRTFLDAALAGGVVALLYGAGDGFVLVLVAGEPPDLRAVALPGWPDPRRLSVGEPTGAVASYGDRFLVAYGPSGPAGLSLRLRAVTAAQGRLIPVNAPGAPGSDGAPALELPRPAPGAPPVVLLHGYPQGVVLAAAFPGAGSAAGRAVVRTATGAPVEDDVFGWRLAFDPSGDRWRIESPNRPEPIPYLGPFGRFALGVTAAGEPVLVPGAPDGRPFAFADGWVPAAGEALRFGNERVAHEERRADGGTLVVVHDARGVVMARLALPPGRRVLAVSRSPHELLVLEPDGGPALCRAGGPSHPPARLDPSAAFDHPTTGAGTCGR